MSDQQLKDFLYELLNDLNHRTDTSVTFAINKIQAEISRLNTKRNTAPMLTKTLNQEEDGDLLFAAPTKRGR